MHKVILKCLYACVWQIFYNRLLTQVWGKAEQLFSEMA